MSAAYRGQCSSMMSQRPGCEMLTKTPQQFFYSGRAAIKVHGRLHWNLNTFHKRSFRSALSFLLV